MDSPDEKRGGDRRRDPMGDEAADDALTFLNETAAAAGKAKAEATYMKRWRKIVRARLKRESAEKSDVAKEAWALAHPKYEEACIAEYAANENYEILFWKRLAAEATIEAWRTKNANIRIAGRMQ